MGNARVQPAHGFAHVHRRGTGPDILAMVRSNGVLWSLVCSLASGSAFTTITSTSTTAWSQSECGGVTRCIHNAHCAECLSAINATPGFPHTQAEYNNPPTNANNNRWSANRAINVGFFRALQSTASCSPIATPPGILYPALQELNTVGACQDAFGMLVSPCPGIEYTCFLDNSCRQCLAALYTTAAADGNTGTKADVFRSPACATTSPAMLNELNNFCGGTTFPKCTFAKQQCASLHACGSCLATIVTGDGAGAARQCSGSTQPSALALDSVVDNCIASDPVACVYWGQRCADNANCSACLSVMGNGDSLSDIASDWSIPACQMAVHDSVAVQYLSSIATGCPGISTCRNAVTSCVVFFGDGCITCINMAGSTSPANLSGFCSELMRVEYFDSACQRCPASVHTINSVVFATAMVGGASAAVCLAVATTIVAHGRDRFSMRDRIVVGLMLTNAVYSTANAIPINALRTGAIDCGRLAMSFDAIRFGRAWWFCGKYGLVGFELLILGASIQAMRRGMSSGVPWHAEAVMHIACFALAVIAFVVFYSLCARINIGGYNATTEHEVYTDAYNHANANDDLDDLEPSADASSKFQSGRDTYDNLVRDMLVAWDAVVVVAVAMWIVLRAVHLHALRAMRIEAAAVVRAEASDVWRDTRQSAWKARRRLLEARREVFNEVAKPLEPYIFVFAIFAVPAFVMSTAFCTSHSGASAVGGVSAGVGVGGGSTDLTFGACDVWCELVLAFRSLGAVAVYLVPRQRRAELVDVRSTWRKLCTRLFRFVRCAPSSPYGELYHDVGNEMEMSVLEEQQQSVDQGHDNAPKTVAVPARADVSSSVRINECDIIMVRPLGRGAFGEVWEAALQPDNRRVAVKVMLVGPDDDGDFVDLNVDEDFRKECDALRRVNSPHLLRFLGFGTTAEGKGFIVTELMLGGSLEDLLHNRECDLSWRARAAIALQVALGMNHLHERHMLHRDLKSANVLLDEELKAKVCDFGLSRVVRPARRQVVVRSSFTGVTRLLPNVSDAISVYDGQSALSSARVAVSFSDARGDTMTKAAGTLLWMAPEVFRGDQTYTKAVDVYSFGIVLWELATRQTPWVCELPPENARFLESLNLALQSGRRPAIPGTVVAEHSAFVTVMQRCWAGDPDDRLTFSDAATDLAACLQMEISIANESP